MIKQKSVTLKDAAATLTYAEMGDIIVNSETAVTITLPTPALGLWYRVSSVGEGLVTIEDGSEVEITTLKQTEQAMVWAASTSAWWMSKGAGAMTKAEIEAVLTGEISSHTHADNVLDGASAPATSTAGTLGQFYLETSTPALYQCTAIDGETYTWTEIGGGAYTLPQAAEAVLGGIKAKTKTTESSEIAIDATTGKLYGPAPDEAANGMPAGGTENQLLAKKSATDYDGKWVDPPSGGTTYENAIDEPPASPNSLDDEFDGSSLDAKWSWNNQGTSVATVANDRLSIDIGAMSDNSSVIYQSVPAGDFIATAKVRVFSKGDSYYGSYIGVINSANNRRINLGRSCRPTGNDWIHCTKPWTSDILLKEGFAGWLYVRVALSSGTLTFSFSEDGLLWIVAFSEAVTTWIGAITGICIAAGRNNTGADKAYALCEWFRVTE